MTDLIHTSPNNNAAKSGKISSGIIIIFVYIVTVFPDEDYIRVLAKGLWSRKFSKYFNCNITQYFRMKNMTGLWDLVFPDEKHDRTLEIRQGRCFQTKNMTGLWNLDKGGG
ncbi:hypothetical protein RhiirA5_379252 [Rhizophagus irregularis]|uniref:Uncharacterized protein n=1 Tax=Rhizophagus irregularis TaxID=588596 RepID=A0A2N0PCT2_9GLOM|nr:hypothetical protein RhiirA5_379252 [Rhizophagus irregularis]